MSAWWPCATGAHSIPFVSAHVETLHEIAIEHRAQARRLGIEDFRLVPGLNGSPRFIGALAGW
jgi:ferrochelatase